MKRIGLQRRREEGGGRERERGKSIERRDEAFAQSPERLFILPEMSYLSHIRFWVTDVCTLAKWALSKNASHQPIRRRHSVPCNAKNQAFAFPWSPSCAKNMYICMYPPLSSLCPAACRSSPFQVANSPLSQIPLVPFPSIFSESKRMKEVGIVFHEILIMSSSSLSPSLHSRTRCSRRPRCDVR